MLNRAVLIGLLVGLTGALRAQEKPEQGAVPKTEGLDTEVNRKMAQGAMESMAHEHMHDNPHMVMTSLRPPAPEDAKRAEEIVAVLGQSIEKYKDYRVALGDNFRIFLPNIPQPMYHFTNYRYGLEAETTFDPARPTSLLYRKTATGYELIGAMYTASRVATEEELNQRIPLSVARWHAHVRICLPPRGQPAAAGQPAQLPDLTRFGTQGSISTEAECTAAGGRFLQQIFGWMVHAYPFEASPEKIWAH